MVRKSKLHLAAHRGDLALLEERLAKGAAVDSRWGEGFTPLMLAADEGHFEAVRLLFEAGADPVLGDDYGVTALHNACYRGHTEIVRLLLELTGGVGVTDSRGRTPLHFAASGHEGTLTTARLLIESSADIEAKDEDGETPLTLSGVSQNLGVCYLLVSADANLHHRNVYGHTAYVAAERQLSGYCDENGEPLLGYEGLVAVVRDILRLTSTTTGDSDDP